MSKIHNFRELKTWKKSRLLVKEVYLITKQFPKEELYGLISQMRRAVVSIPSNIAEGCGRQTNPQLSQFLDIAHGSSCELETQIYLSFDLNYIEEAEMNILLEKINEIQKMIISFKNSLN
jgi:four helix bundle protein